VNVFFKKDFLVYWRDRKEMLIAFILPLVLVVILGFALSGWVENSNENIEIKAALVMLDQSKEGLERFQYKLNSLPLTADEKTAISKAAEAFIPGAMLLDMLNSDETKGFLNITQLDEESALKQLNEEKVDAIILVPEGYTEAALNSLLLRKGGEAEITLTADTDSLNVQVLQNMLDSFLSDVNNQAALSSASRSYGGAEISGAEASLPLVGGMEQMEGVEMITSFQYFALAISIFFALSVSTTTASKSITEKREQVFMRILLAGTHPLRYLAGKAASTFCMSVLQLAVLLVISHFIYDLFPGKSLEFWIGLSFILIMLCLAIAALAALYTAMLFRMKDADVASGISFLLLIVFGIIGGNLVPIYILPDWAISLGNVTPNGLALSMLLQWIQGSSFDDLWQPVFYQAIFCVAIVGASVWIFPRRGRL